MHWTLLALLELCAGCVLLNLIQWRAVGKPRLTGILVCSAWAVQQVWWAIDGNSLVLTLTCDVLLLWYFLGRRASNHWSDWLICVLIPATMLIYVPEYLYGQTVRGWWLNWSLVAIQMLLGLPMGSRQKIGGSVSHGELKHGGA